MILRTYPGTHGLEEHIYVDPDGNEILYHTVSTPGPYESKGQATAQIKREITYHQRCIQNGVYRSTLYGRPGTVPSLTTFVETVVPAWSMVPETKATI